MKKQAKKIARKQARKIARRGEVVIKHTSRHRDQPEEFRESREPVDDLPEHPAGVVVSGGMTKKTGDFEYARLDVSISIPCANSEAAIRRTYKQASALVEDMLQQEYDALEIE